MAFMTKIKIDLTGIVFLILVTATSQATNQDCNGKAFRCVNSTHFNICVDLGGISTTIDDVIIPCPAPTVCLNTNRFECEFPVPATPSETSAVTTVSEVTTDTPLKTTTQFEQYFDTISTTTLPEDVPRVTDALSVEPINQKPNIEHSSITENVISVLPKQNATLFQSDFNVIPANINVGNVNGNTTTTLNNTTSKNNNVTMSFKYDNIGFQKVIPTSVDSENVTSKFFTNTSYEKNNDNIIVDAVNEREIIAIKSNIDAVNVSKTDYTSFSTDQPLITNFNFVNENQTVGINISDYDYSTTVPDKFKNKEGTKDETAITAIRTDITGTSNNTQAKINQTSEKEFNTTGTKATIFPTSYNDLKNITVDTTGGANNTQTRINHTLKKEFNTTEIETTASGTSYIDLENVTVDTTDIANNNQTRLNQTLEKEPNTIGIGATISLTSYIDLENVTVDTTGSAINTQTRLDWTEISTEAIINQKLEKDSNITRIETPISSTSYIDFVNVTVDTTGSANSTLASINQTLEKESTITGIETTISKSYIDLDNVTVDTTGSANNTQTRLNQTLKKASNTTGIETTSPTTSFNDFENFTLDTTGSANNTETRINQSLEKESNITVIETTTSPTSYVDFENVTLDIRLVIQPTTELPELLKNNVSKTNITIFVDSVHSSVLETKMNVDVNLTITPESTTVVEIIGPTQLFTTDNMEPNTTVFAVLENTKPSQTTIINGSFNSELFTPSIADEVNVVGEEINARPVTTVYKEASPLTENSSKRNPESINTSSSINTTQEALNVSNSHIKIIEQEIHSINDDIIKQDYTNSIIPTIYEYEHNEKQISTESPFSDLIITTNGPSTKIRIISRESFVETTTRETLFMKLETPKFTASTTASISIPDTEKLRNTTNSTKASKGSENLQLNKTINSHSFINKTTSLTANIITKPTVNVESSSKPDALIIFNYAETSTKSPANIETNTENGVSESFTNTIALDPTQINPIYELQSDAESMDFINPMIEHGGNSTGKLVLKDQALRIDYIDKFTTTVSESDMIINGPTVSTVIDETHSTPKLLSLNENIKSVNKTFVQTNIDSESTSKLSLSNILSSSNVSSTIDINQTNDIPKIQNYNSKLDVTAETFTYSQITSTTDKSTISRRNETSGNLVENVEIITNTENTIISDTNNNVTLTKTITTPLPAITAQSTTISTEQNLAVPITLTKLPPVSTVTTEAFVPTVYIAAEPTNQGDLNAILFNVPIDKKTQTTTQIITTYKNLTNSNKTTAMDINSGLLENSTKSITEPTGKQSLNLESALLKNITAVFEIPLIGSNRYLNISVLESANKPINTPIRSLDKELIYITSNTPIILYIDTETQSKSETPKIKSADSKLSENIDYSTKEFNSAKITTQTPMPAKYDLAFANPLFHNFEPLSIPQENIHKLTSSHLINNSAPKSEDPLGSVNNVPRKSATDNLDHFYVTELSHLSIPIIKGQQSDVSSSIYSIDTTSVTQEHLPTIASAYNSMVIDAIEKVPITKHIKENVTFHVPREAIEKEPLSIQNTTETVLNFIKNTTNNLLSEDTTQNIDSNIFEPITLDPINNSEVADKSKFTNTNTEVTAIDSIVQISINLSQKKSTENSQTINITKVGPTEYFVKQNITPSTLPSTLSSPKPVLSATYLHLDTQSIAMTDATTAISDSDKVTTESLHNNRTNVLQDMMYNVTTNYPVLKNNSTDNRYNASSSKANITESLGMLNHSYLHESVTPTLNISTETKNPQIFSNIYNDVITMNTFPDLTDKPITESTLMNTNVTSSTEFSITSSTESLLLKVSDSPVITTENSNNQNTINNANKITPINEMVAVTTSLTPLEQTEILSSTVTGTVTGNKAVESKSAPYLPAFQSVTKVNTDYATLGKQLVDTNAGNLLNMNKMTVTPVSQSTALPKTVINVDKGTAAETHTISAMKFREPNLIKETVTIKVPDQMIKNTESIVHPSLLGSPYDFENITPIINSNVLLVKNIESEITHSGIISSVPITTKRTETKTPEKSKKKDEREIYENSGNKKSDDKENVGNDEENKGELINVELTSLQDKITPSAHTNVTFAKENTNKVLKKNSTREELLITTGYTKFAAKNDHIVPMSTNYSSTYNINNVTNTSVNGHKKNTPTRDSLENSPPRNVNHTSNIKSQDQNISIPQTRNTTVISKDQSTTTGNMSQTKSTAVNTQATAFPALSTTRKTNISKFSCGKKRGKFSDSNDCRKFYLCQGNDIAVEKACPVNTVFSEINKQCTKNLSHCIRNNQFRCVAEGRFSDFLNDNVYYICVKNNLSHFIRFKLLCQNGYRLNKTSVRCVLNKESISTSESSKSVSEQSSSPAKIRTPVKTKKFKCKEEGIFPDPSNCRKYFICTEGDNSAYRKKAKICDSDEVFHKDKKKCVDVDSHEC